MICGGINSLVTSKKNSALFLMQIIFSNDRSENWELSNPSPKKGRRSKICE